jgi:hypothetical protein
VTPERYQMIKAAFRQALPLPPSEQLTYLRRAYPGDEPLIDEVRLLLDADHCPSTPLDHPVVSDEFRLRTATFAYTALRR